MQALIYRVRCMLVYSSFGFTIVLYFGFTLYVCLCVIDFLFRILYVLAYIYHMFLIYSIGNCIFISTYISSYHYESVYINRQIEIFHSNQSIQQKQAYFQTCLLICTLINTCGAFTHSHINTHSIMRGSLEHVFL